jgi:hypothetical protein
LDAGHAAAVVSALVLAELENSEDRRLDELFVTPSDRGPQCGVLAAMRGIVEPPFVMHAAPAEVDDPVPGSLARLMSFDRVPASSMC